jgi:hypothetical protein
MSEERKNARASVENTYARGCSKKSHSQSINQ